MAAPVQGQLFFDAAHHGVSRPPRTKGREDEAQEDSDSKCAIPWCQFRIPSGRVLCTTHRAMVGVSLQREECAARDSGDVRRHASVLAIIANAVRVTEHRDENGKLRTDDPPEVAKRIEEIVTFVRQGPQGTGRNQRPVSYRGLSGQACAILALAQRSTKILWPSSLAPDVQAKLARHAATKSGPIGSTPYTDRECRLNLLVSIRSPKVLDGETDAQAFERFKSLGVATAEWYKVEQRYREEAGLRSLPMPELPQDPDTAVSHTPESAEPSEPSEYYAIEPTPPEEELEEEEAHGGIVDIYTDVNGLKRYALKALPSVRGKADHHGNLYLFLEFLCRRVPTMVGIEEGTRATWLERIHVAQLDLWEEMSGFEED